MPHWQTQHKGPLPIKPSFSFFWLDSGSFRFDIFIIGDTDQNNIIDGKPFTYNGVKRNCNDVDKNDRLIITTSSSKKPFYHGLWTVMFFCSFFQLLIKVTCLMLFPCGLFLGCVDNTTCSKIVFWKSWIASLMKIVKKDSCKFWGFLFVCFDRETSIHM